MYAEIGYMVGGEMKLYLFRSKKAADEQGGQEAVLHSLSLTNEDITELVVVQKIKPINYGP